MRFSSSGPCSASEQQWPHRILPVNLCRMAAAAIRSSERAAGSVASSTWKSRSNPWAVAVSNMMSSAASSASNMKETQPRMPLPWRFTASTTALM